MGQFPPDAGFLSTHWIPVHWISEWRGKYVFTLTVYHATSLIFGKLYRLHAKTVIQN